MAFCREGPTRNVVLACAWCACGLQHVMLCPGSQQQCPLGWVVPVMVHEVKKSGCCSGEQRAGCALGIPQVRRGTWPGSRMYARKGCSHTASLSPHTALASEVLPAAQPGQTRLRVNRFEVTLVELPGAQRCRNAWRSHYGAADGLLFVLDSSDLARMEEARKARSRIRRHPDGSGTPLLL